MFKILQRSTYPRWRREREPSASSEWERERQERGRQGVLPEWEKDKSKGDRSFAGMREIMDGTLRQSERDREWQRDNFAGGRRTCRRRERVIMRGRVRDW
jgi:hypothetical protein